MIIGIDASRYNHNEATGVEWYSKHIIEGILKLVLKENGDKVRLYSGRKLNLPQRILKGKEDKVEIRIIESKRFWTLWKLSWEIHRDSPDVLFVPSHTFPLSLPKHRVIMIHDVAFRHLRHAYSFKQYHYLNWSTKFAVKKANKIITPSEATAHDLKYFFKCPEEKIEVIQHGFSAPDISQKQIDRAFKESDVFKYFGIKKDLPYILFVGRLESKKNLANLIRAFARFSETHPSYRLVLAGKRGTGFNHILQTTKKLSILEKVIMPGYITEEEKAALFKYCKLFAFPSLYEGFGLPILEAFYYKKPVLTSKVSSLPEVAGESACYCDPYDPEMIEAGLDKIVNEDQYANSLVESGVKHLEDFKWGEAAEKTLKLIKGY